EHIRVLRDHGIERSSMGVQTLAEQLLDKVERAHDSRQAVDACERLLGAGLIVNIDLIYGLPEQTEADFRRDFETVARLGVHSVTAYNLRVNERTPVSKLITQDEKL